MPDEELPEDDLQERLVKAFEEIAVALTGLRNEAKKAGSRFWPSPRGQKQAIASRVETDEERELKRQGAWRRTAGEATDPEADEDSDEGIGERTRQWLRDHPEEAKKAKVPDAGSQGPANGKAGGSSAEATES